MIFVFTRVYPTNKEKHGLMVATMNANVKMPFMVTTDVTNGKYFSIYQNKRNLCFQT